MSTYTTNTKPESKFEDVPEEVLTDPTMRTALGMDPIPGMNTPVDDNKQISMFDYMQNKNNYYHCCSRGDSFQESCSSRIW